MIRLALLCAFILCTSGTYAQKNIVIYFDSGKYDLSRNSQKTLDSLSDILSAEKNSKVDLSGYCDASGGDQINDPLSLKRAQTVGNYLRGKHIEVAGEAGKSARNPAAENLTEAGKARNRRTEIAVFRKIPVSTEADLVKEEPKTEYKGIPFQKATEFDPSRTDEQIKAGKLLSLKNLNFVGGTADLLPESQPTLILLLQLLKDRPGMEIEIEGHVCCAPDYWLSVERAEAVQNYLIRNGINKNRLSFAGHSWDFPVAAEKDEEGRKANRRVEIMVLKE
jgi:outer membrane protein OmpA-like peptidoglycan-associated protein